MLLSPDNPTGRVIKKEIAKAILDLAVDHGFYIYCDDAYKHIIYEGEHVWISTLSKSRENVITMCSFSKEAAVPGLRVGYMYGPAEIIDAAEKLKQYVTLCPDTLTQYGLIRFLTGDAKERYLKWALPIYKTRRDAMEKQIHKYLPKGRTVRPYGAFYIFVDMHEYIEPLRMKDEEFCLDLLRKKEVAIIPGEHFGENGRRHCRFTFVSEPEERIERGVARVAEYLREAGVA
jgi:aspartate aminotransferase